MTVSCPVEQASTSGNVGVINLLLKKGADVSVTDKDGVTTLMSAASHGHAQVWGQGSSILLYLCCRARSVPLVSSLVSSVAVSLVMQAPCRARCVCLVVGGEGAGYCCCRGVYRGCLLLVEVVTSLDMESKTVKLAKWRIGGG